MRRRFASRPEVESRAVLCDPDAALRALQRGDEAGAAQACPDAGLVVARDPDGGALVLGGEAHSAVFSRTGQGKTRRVLAPLLRTLALSGAPFVCHDCKGELLEGASTLLAIANYRVHVIDLRRPARSSSGYNPLAQPWDEWSAGRPDRAYQLIRDVAEVLYAGLDERASDPYWTRAAADWFCAICLGMLESGVEREAFGLESVALFDRQAMERGASTGKAFFSELPERSAARQHASGVLEAPNDTRASIFAVFRQPLALYTSQEALMDVLCASDFAPADLAEGRTALFLVSPDESRAMAPVVSCLLNQVMSGLVGHASLREGGRLARRVHLVLDEFGNLPKVPCLEDVASAGRSRGLRLHVALQSDAQLEEVYGAAAAKNILANVEDWLFLGTRDRSFLEHVSGLAGTCEDARGRRVPVAPAHVLQRLEKRPEETEALVLARDLRPFVAALPDVGTYAAAPEAPLGLGRLGHAPRPVFSLERWKGDRLEEMVRRALA